MASGVGDDVIGWVFDHLEQGHLDGCRRWYNVDVHVKVCNADETKAAYEYPHFVQVKESSSVYHRSLVEKVNRKLCPIYPLYLQCICVLYT